MISTHAPLAGRDAKKFVVSIHTEISTHAPLAGRDRLAPCTKYSAINFNPRAPCGARRRGNGRIGAGRRISTHAPLAGRDWLPFQWLQ